MVAAESSSARYRYDIFEIIDWSMGSGGTN